MIDTVSQSAKIQGSVYEYKTGTYSRGGENNTEGVSIIDQQTNESHPLVTQETCLSSMTIFLWSKRRLVLLKRETNYCTGITSHEDESKLNQ